ncbi:MAG TPA: bifunctional oligoribonuclease/PAP phosphatase NrnA [Ktedonobacterales bacterium]|nr:bifunctional oligoribonuclease/PAP phosphatase NrnA [Ktedonobacterales bacterium]
MTATGHSMGARAHSDLAQLLAGEIDSERSQAAWRMIMDARRIVLLAHHNPDPDALGSALGLAHALRPFAKDWVVACADPAPEGFTFLPGRERVVTELPDEDFDLVVALDAGDLARYGALYERHKAFFDRAPILNIDHHASSTGCGVVNIIDPTAAATAELITLLLLNNDIEINQDAAECLLAGVITDTRSFEFDATTERTLAVGAYLVGCGAVPETIVKPMYRMKPFAQVRLWGRVLQTAQTASEGRVIWATLSRRDMEESGATQDMDDGLPAYLLDVEGVEIAVLLREGDKNSTRVSVRTSGPWDGSKMTMRFGGGGHMRAAGCTVHKPLQQAEKEFMEYVLKVIATGEY